VQDMDVTNNVAMHGWNELSTTDTLLVDTSNNDEFKLYTLFTHKSQTNRLCEDSIYETKPLIGNYGIVNTVNPNFNLEQQRRVSIDCEIEQVEAGKDDFKFNLEIEENIPTYDEKKNIPKIREMDSNEENSRIR
jgi:hypothetical protein